MKTRLVLGLIALAVFLALSASSIMGYVKWKQVASGLNPDSVASVTCWNEKKAKTDTDTWAKEILTEVKSSRFYRYNKVPAGPTPSGGVVINYRDRDLRHLSLASWGGGTFELSLPNNGGQVLLENPRLQELVDKVLK